MSDLRRPGLPVGPLRVGRRAGARLSAFGCAVLIMLAGSLVEGVPAFADIATNDCAASLSGAMSFNPSTVTLGQSTILTWNASFGSACGNATFELQSFEGFGGAVASSGSMTVTPVTTTSGALAISMPPTIDGVWSQQIVAATVIVNTPPPLAEGTTVNIRGGGIAALASLVQAVATPRARVNIAGDVNLNLSGLHDVTVAPGVQIIGDRSVFPMGPRLFTATFPPVLFAVGSGGTPSDGVRVNGIRLDGGMSDDPYSAVDTDDAVGILVNSSQHVEIDHNEIYRWRGAGVAVRDTVHFNGGPESISLQNASTVWVHDNYIHHDQHPTGDIFGGGHGAGYGVEVGYGAYALIEKNVFDYNRHAIMGDGKPGTGYLAYRNLILTNGGVNSALWHTHQIDMHGTGADCSGECGAAGEYMDVQYNTIWYINGDGVKLRGTPSMEMRLENNVFRHSMVWPSLPLNPHGAMNQTETGLHQSNNTFASYTFPDRKSCDFDGDGVADDFIATGITWWYASSRLSGRWVYLNQSHRLTADITLRDVNGDGHCDVITDGVVYNGGAAPMHTDLLWTRAAASASIWQMTGTTIGAQPSPGTLTGVLGTGDFDGDGRSDVLERDATGGVKVGHLIDGHLLNGSEPQPMGNAADAGGTLWTFAGISDFDGDGYADVLWRRPDGHFEIWFGGTSVRSALVSGSAVDPRWQVKGVGDFNGDGKADILFRNSDSGQVTIWRMNGAQLISATAANTMDPSGALDPTGVWQVAGVGDLNGGGQADILWRKTDGTLLIWFNGTAAGSVALAPKPDAFWQVAGIGDFNADVRSDIVWQHSQVATGTGGAGQVVIWTMNGGQLLQTPTLGSVDGSWTLAGLLPTTGAKPVPLPVSPGNQTSVAGTPVSLTLSVSGGIAPYTWSVSGLPTGLSANSAGQISGTPVATAATATVTAWVTDANGQPSPVSFTWTVVIKVPNLFGHTSAEASVMLHSAGLVPNPGGSIPIDAIDLDGKVVNQSIAAGTQVTLSTSVSFSFGKYMPDICGPNPC